MQITELCVCRRYDGLYNVRADNNDQVVWYDCVTWPDIAYHFGNELAAKIMADTTYWQKTDVGEYQTYAASEMLYVPRNYPKNQDLFNQRDTFSIHV